MNKIHPRAALVVVDVQNGFVNDNSRHVLPAVVRLIEQWRDGGGRVYLTKFTNLPGSKWEKLIGWTRLRTAPETDLHPDVAPFAGLAQLVVKDNLYTSVTGALAQDIAEGLLDDIYICGIATESCVLATALAVFEAKEPIQPFVVSDACASHAGEAAHEAGLLVIQRFIGRGQVVSSDELS